MSQTQINDLIYIQTGNYTKYYSLREMYLFVHDYPFKHLKMIVSKKIGL